MTFKTLMVIKAAACLIIGIPMLVVPKQLLSLLGVTLGAGGILVARLYGAAILGNLMLTWFGRNVALSGGRRAICIQLLVYDAIGGVVALVATLSGGMNALGWAAVFVYLFIAFGFGYFLFKKPTAA